MKEFNKDRELRKLRFKQNKSKYIKIGTIGLSVVILIIGIVYFSFARFESNAEFTIIDGKVGNFSKGDMIFAFNVDGSNVSSIPENDDTYFYLSNSCTNGTTYTVTNGNWRKGTIDNFSEKGTKCTFNFSHPTVKFYLDDVETTKEEATSHYYFKENCNKGSMNYNILNKTYTFSNITEQNVVCNIYYTTENTGVAPIPELYQGLVPVKYVDNNIVIASTSDEWYNYDNHEWANAVIPTSDARAKTAGQTLSESEILQMYVWIPRYKYKLWNAVNGSSDEQMIEVQFEDKNTTKSTGSTNGTWLTHPAFTFGSTELNGIWVGKFESSHTTLSSSTTNNNLGCSNENCDNASGIQILPNKVSLRYNNIANQFYASRSIENTSTFGLNASQIDTHMMKNMEWGAVAYLSHSKYGRYNSDQTCVSGGCEIWINNNISYTTGCAGDSVSAPETSTCNQWNTANGVHASATDNQYGVYDMSGGAYDDVMGNVAMASTYTYQASYSELATKPEDKYVDRYINPENTETAHKNGKLGDATKETLKTFGDRYGGWYSDYAIFPNSSQVWFVRGGNEDDRTKAGAFNFRYIFGGAASGNSFRVVLTAQDGNS